jgi:NitT/TauT family transport system substrate-binding protein
MKHASPAVIAVAAVALMSPAGAQDKPEMPKVRLAVGGKSAIFYLPLSITERLGYFRDAGLEVEIADVQSGARALQSLVGGSAEVGVGTFDHTIQMHPKASRS